MNTVGRLYDVMKIELEKQRIDLAENVSHSISWYLVKQITRYRQSNLPCTPMPTLRDNFGINNPQHVHLSNNITNSRH